MTPYGWSYDKDMDPTDPAHLAEYHIIQRGVRTPAQGGKRGISFTSDGVEYTTYRTVRREKPSIKIPPPSASTERAEGAEANGLKFPDMDNFDASDDPTYQLFAV